MYYGLAQSPCDQIRDAVERRACQGRLLVMEQANAGERPNIAAGVQSDMERMQQEVMREAVTGAALTAGITLALSLAGPVGAAISAVAGLVVGFTGQRYQQKLEEHVAKRQKELERYVARKQQELNEALDQSYREAYRVAAKLAVSHQPLVISDTSFESLWTVNGLGIIDKLTGKSTYDEGKSRIDRAVAKAKRQIREFADPIIAEVQRAGFKALLGKQIAIAMRKNLQFIAQLEAQGIPAPPSYLDAIQDPNSPAYTPQAAGSGRSAMPFVIGGAAVVALALWRLFK